MFKKHFVIPLIVFVLSTLYLPIPQAQAQTSNLIANPDVEVKDNNNNQPIGWYHNSWGQSDSKFSYETGFQNSMSLKVEVLNYVSGDSKWYFEPVDILPETEYFFGDYYRSSSSSDLVARYTLQDDSFIYQYIGSNNSSDSWQKARFVFQTPANSKKITIFHLIKSDGFLQTDSFMLKKAQRAVITDNVPNNSLEEVSESTRWQPLAWQSNSWGQNTAKFSYQRGGHTGRWSIKTEITSYTDGDAKWYYDPQPMPGGQTFQFTDYYKSNVLSRVVLQITKNDGSIEYMSLRSAGPVSSWTEYSDIFTTPIDTKTITVFHLISSVGFLITDDYSIIPFTGNGFDRPLLTMTFDDSWEINFTTVLPKLDQYGVKSTQYYATTYIENNFSEAYYKISGFIDHGHEIGSHSITHPFLTQLSDEDLEEEIANSQAFLQNFTGQEIRHFATPYGDYDGRTISYLQNYYLSNRNTDVGYNYKEGFDIMNIRVQNITRTTTLAEFQSWLQKAQDNNTWLVLVYHRVASDPDFYDTTPESFSNHLQAIQQSGITVKTTQAALDEILPQID